MPLVLRKEKIMDSEIPVQYPVEILLVEPTPADARKIKDLLKEMQDGHYNLVHAKKMAEALKRLEEKAFDVALLSIPQPGTSPFESIEQINNKAPATAVITLSKLDDEETAVESVIHGAMDYLIKDSLDAVTLGRSIRYAVDRKRADVELARKDDQIRHLQRLETLEILARGVAHNFNNIMTIITGYSDLLLGRLEADDPSRRIVQEIQAAARRANILMQQMMACSSPETPVPTQLDLNQVITDLNKLLRPLLGSKIDLVTKLGRDLGKVEADMASIEQLIVNTAINARDAMPHGGQLTIETDNVDLDDTFSHKGEDFKPGPYVMLAFSDISADTEELVKAGVTKESPDEDEQNKDGEGTPGPGLATIHGLVKHLGGYIVVYGEVGQGTTFKIYLPTVKTPASILAEEDLTPKRLRGTETVLLVDDEESVRSMVSDALKLYGYNVLEAGNGEEAIQVAGKHSGEIDLLVTDLVMPRMGGRELAENLRPFHSNMKILFISGYTAQAAVNLGVLDQDAPFLHKPFSIDTFLLKVREVIETPAI